MKLKKILENHLSAAESALLVNSYDVVGDIAIISVPDELLHHESLIGQAVLANNQRIKVVAKRAGMYAGEYRTIPLTIIAGDNRTETEHREHGIRLFLNPEKVYFSTRSCTERRRIAALVEPGEKVLVMFSGVAPYPLVIAAGSRAGVIVGIEKNPEAHAYALLNLARNRKFTNISLLCGDVLAVLPRLNHTFDRIIMPLPGNAASFLPGALSVLRLGGLLHFYDFQSLDSLELAVDTVRHACQEAGRMLLATVSHRCGHCAPRKHRLCVDARIG